MKTLKTLLFIAIVIVGFNLKSSAQVSDDFNAKAKVIAAITIENQADLNFGSFAASSATGTVTISTDGARSKTGTLTLSSISAGSKGSFNIGGQGGYTYAITLPANNVTISNGTQTMSITDWKAKSAELGSDGTSGKIAAGGTDVLTIGATLNVGATQDAGDYTGTFAVTVNYN